MKTLIEIIVFIIMLSIVLFSLKLAYGYTQQHIDDSMKADEENSRLIDKFALVLNTCAYRITAGDTSIMDACDRFENVESRHFEQLLNESRPDIDKILLD